MQYDQSVSTQCLSSKGRILAVSSMSRSTSGTKRVSFAKLREPLEVPNLLALQTDSFDWLVGGPAWRARQTEPTPSGLDEILDEISPIEDFSGNLSLSFSDPRFDEVKANEEECRDKDMTYSAPLFVTAEFMNGETGEIKSQTVFMGDFPMMTSKGTFIINGTERVVVSQLVRSPGVYFDKNLDKTAGKDVFSVKVIPSRGAWLEFDIDKRDTIGVRIDRKRRQPVTVLLKALGWDAERIREHFSWSPVLLATLEKDHIGGQDEALLDIYRKLRPGEPPTKESAQALLDNLFFKDKRYDLAKVGRYKVNKKLGVNKPTSVGTLTEDDLLSTVEYLLRLHQGDEEWTISTGEQRPVEIDDIDHFGNRRLRTVGELIQNQIRVGLSRMERVVRERMTTQDVEAITPQTLINIRPVVASIKEFFGTSQLSQFMDQTNPLAGLTHKRRLSALGPGGLSRDRASLEVRDVHPSHYGRMCPIETPEGPNIGLIGSLATFARVNPFGFIETPYRKVNDGIASDDIEYLTADEEDRFIIAQASAKLDGEGRFTENRVLVRRKGSGEVDQVLPDEVEYMDVSPRQTVSVATAMIPFLEHDEANRALMGANMQRQSVPLLRSEAPLVGTGMEARAAKDAGDVVIAEKSGVVEEATADYVSVMNDDGTHRTYRLNKFRRSNQGTSFNQKPDRRRGRAGRSRPGHRRRSVHRRRRDGARQEPAGRVHAVGGPQLRGRDHPVPAHRPGRRADLDPHRGARDRRPRHQARAGGDHPGHPERLRGRAGRPRRARHHPHRRRGAGRRHPGRQGHAQGRDRADPGGAAAARDLRREGPRGPRHLAEGAARRDRQGDRHPGVQPRGRRRRAAARASTSWSASTWPRSGRSRTATSSPAGTATRASSARSCPPRTCPSCPTAPRSTSCSTRTACRAG